MKYQSEDGGTLDLAEGGRRPSSDDMDGWDYGEYAITNDDPWIPRTHGGVSGGAAWRIDLPIDGSGRKSVILDGVVFAEGPEETEARRESAGTATGP